MSDPVAFLTEVGLIPAVDATHFELPEVTPSLAAYLRYVNHEAEAYFDAHGGEPEPKILGYRDWLAENRRTMQ